MYLIINGEKHSVSRREKKKDQVVYYTVKPMPVEVSGFIEMYRDDGFLMSRDTVADYARQTKSGTVLTLTNRAEPVPTVSAPTLESRVAAIENAITKGLSL